MQLELEETDMRNNTRYHGTRLGSLLVKRGLITPDQLERALQSQRDRASATLGQILLEQGLISEATPRQTRPPARN